MATIEEIRAVATKMKNQALQHPFKAGEKLSSWVAGLASSPQSTTEKLDALKMCETDSFDELKRLATSLEQHQYIFDYEGYNIIAILTLDVIGERKAWHVSINSKCGLD